MSQRKGGDVTISKLAGTAHSLWAMGFGEADGGETHAHIHKD